MVKNKKMIAEHIEELAIFDFDGTLVDTPLPDTGRLEYAKKTGNEWPHKGWWAQPESLNMEIFEMTSNPSVLADFIAEKANPKSFVILLTGRLSKLENEVKKICVAKGLECDAYYFNTGGSTDVVKMRTMDKLLLDFPHLKVVKMWEDRLSHISLFEEWGKAHCLSGRLQDFKISVVINPDRDSNH